MNTEIWNIFTTDPTTGVTLLTLDGEVRYINEQAIRIFFEEPVEASSVIGKTISEMGFPEPWVEERLELFQKMKESGGSVLLRTVWRGKQQFSWMSLITTDGEDDGERALVITRRIPATEEAESLLEGDHDVVKSDVIRLGELESLTPRELEVLALLGQGMSIKEIAGALFRSIKTIENHRESIGRKLKKTRGIELANLARVAGLSLEDSTRKRVDGLSESERAE